MTAGVTRGEVRCPHCGTGMPSAVRFCRSCGQPMPELGSPSRAENVVVATTRWRRVRLPAWSAWPLRHWRGLGAAVIAAAVVIYGVVLWTGNTVTNSPDKPVREFFSALAARDAAKVHELTRLGGPMAAASMAAGVYTPPSDVVIGEVTYRESVDPTKRPNHDAAHVKVSYSVGGQRIEGAIEVLREQDGAIREWFLGDGGFAPVVIVSKHTGLALLGGVEVKTVKEAPLNTSGAVRAPIGLYQLTTVDADPLFTADPVNVAVAGTLRAAKAVPFPLTVKVSPKVQPRIEAQVKHLLDECAKETSLDMYTCPFRLDKIVVLPRDVSWKIGSYPVITLSVAARPELGGPIEMHTTTPGSATASYTTATGQRTSDATEIGVGGRVDVDKEDGQAALATFGKD